MKIEQDPYAVLGVTRAATEEDVEEAYRNLTRRARPDAVTVEAYKVLSHPRKRLRYDCFGVRTRRRRQATRVSGIPPIPISLEWYEAERGVTKSAEFADRVVCAECRGRGTEQGAIPEVCPRCGGTGHLDPPEDAEEFHVLDLTACLACEGRGHLPAPRCGPCSGTGSTVVERAVTIRVPPGLGDGDRLLVDGVARPFQLWVGPRPLDSDVVLTVAGISFVFAICFLIYLLLNH